MHLKQAHVLHSLSTLPGLDSFQWFITIDMINCFHACLAKRSDKWLFYAWVHQPWMHYCNIHLFRSGDVNVEAEQSFQCASRQATCLRGLFLLTYSVTFFYSTGEKSVHLHTDNRSFSELNENLFLWLLYNFQGWSQQPRGNWTGNNRRSTFWRYGKTCTLCSGLNYSNLSGPATSHY